MESTKTSITPTKITTHLAPEFEVDYMLQLPSWPILLHVNNLLHLEILELMPWNQLPLPFTFAVPNYAPLQVPARMGYSPILRGCMLHS
jgi:hypothetical protein